MPRWLWLLLSGATIGAAAVVYVQQEHLPPRLSLVESNRLQASHEAAERERSRLDTELGRASSKLEAALAEQQKLAAQLASSQRERGALRANVEALLAALPPDPRGGTVEIRAARFRVDGDRLDYDLVLARPQAGSSPFTGVLHFVVAGRTSRGSEANLALDPVKVAVGRFEIASGSLPMPGGFVPREATVRVLDRVDGKPYGMRVIIVK